MKVRLTPQDEFDLTIGRLDRILSVMIGHAKNPTTDKANRQTLKHHAEDMVAAGNKILELLHSDEATPQPGYC